MSFPSSQAMEVRSLDGLAIGKDPRAEGASTAVAPRQINEKVDCAVSPASPGTIAPNSYFDTVGHYDYVYVCQFWNAL